ncbi:hypothetical protein BH10PAT2_BH10PAT2_1860 [soil metagenome]
MTLTKKKLLLGIFLLLEASFCCLICLGVYKVFLHYRRQAALQKITVLKKENFVFPQNPEFKYFYALTPNKVDVVKPDWSDEPITNTYNEDGLNDRYNYSVEKPANTFRIITLGDSFTFGQNVNTKDNWTEQLEDTLNSQKSSCNSTHFEVINLGMPGFDIPYIAQRYKTVGAKYNPDLVIWFESGSGFTRFDERALPIITACEEREKNASTAAVTKNQYYDCWDEADQELNKLYTTQQVTTTLKGYLDEFLKTQDHKKMLFFTFTPDVFNEQDQKTSSEWQKSYSDILHSASIPNIYALKQALPDAHPSVAGHTTISNTIYDYLRKNVIPSCR